MTAHSGLIIDYLGSGTHAARPATPNIGAGVTSIYYETDTTNTFAWTGAAWVQLNGTGSGGPGPDGWIAAEAWTYVSADGPTGVFSVASDVTAKYSPGMRVRYTQTSIKYGIITAVGAFGGGVTPITIYGGTDYVTANAAISATSYSPVKAPFGFSLNPAKWTVEVDDTTTRTQSSPTGSTWYNLGSVTISIPIGVWDVSYQVTPYLTHAAGGDMSTTLSTANNSQSDADLSTFTDILAGVLWIATVSRRKVIALTSKTSYFLNAMTTASGVTDINFYNTSGGAPEIIRAVCALL